jgi:OOP family OmpA-OmpF porin
MHRAFAISFALAVLLLASACANPPIRASKAVCVTAGAVLGGASGAVIRHQDNDADGTDEIGAGVIGAIAGGTVGYLLCGEPEAPKPMPTVTPAPPPPPPPAPAPRRIVLRGVNFDFDKSEIRPDAAVILDEAASLLSEEPGVRVEVGGHTDATGTDEYNQGLSERRAQSVVDYLVGKGVSAGRLESAGYGESKPVADNATRDGRAQNRRVELNVRQ